MNSTDATEIWIAILAGSGEREQVSLEGLPAWMPKGGECVFHFGIFDELPVSADNPGTIRDHTGIALAQLKIRDTSYAGGLGSAGRPSTFTSPSSKAHLLRPIGSLSSPRLPSSQGSDPASYPAQPPASFRTNRQLSG